MEQKRNLTTSARTADIPAAAFLSFAFSIPLFAFGAAAGTKAGEAVSSNRADTLLEAELCGGMALLLLVGYFFLMLRAKQGRFDE